MTTIATHPSDFPISHNQMLVKNRGPPDSKHTNSRGMLTALELIEGARRVIQTCQRERACSPSTSNICLRLHETTRCRINWVFNIPSLRIYP